jgi:hypothetical protein
MKTEKLPDVPKQEPGDFYYHHLKLPYGNAKEPAAELPFEPDPTISELMDISSDSAEQLGFVILRKDNSLEIVDAATGQHTRVTFGKPKARPKNAQPTAQA